MLDDRQSIAQMNFDVLPTATINFGRVNVRSNDDANNSLVCEADNHPQTFAFTCPESVSSGRFASASSDAVSEGYQAAGRTTPTYSDSAIKPGRPRYRHPNEIRSGLAGF